MYIHCMYVVIYTRLRWYLEGSQGLQAGCLLVWGCLALRGQQVIHAAVSCARAAAGWVQYQTPHFSKLV